MPILRELNETIEWVAFVDTILLFARVCQNKLMHQLHLISHQLNPYPPLTKVGRYIQNIQRLAKIVGWINNLLSVLGNILLCVAMMHFDLIKWTIVCITLALVNECMAIYAINYALTHLKKMQRKQYQMW